MITESLHVLSVSQRLVRSGGGGGEAGRPHRVPETTQHVTEQEAAQPHRSALSSPCWWKPPALRRKIAPPLWEEIWRNKVEQTHLFTHTEPAGSTAEASAPEMDWWRRRRKMEGKGRRWSRGSQIWGDGGFYLCSTSFTDLWPPVCSSESNRAVRASAQRTERLSSTWVNMHCLSIALLFLHVLSLILWINKIFDFSYFLLS